MATQKLKIEIPDPKLQAEEFWKEKITEIQKSFSFYNNIVIGVFLLGFLVLVFTLATIVIQAWQTNSSFQTQMQQIKIQEDLIKNTVKQQTELLQAQEDIKKQLDNMQNNR